MKTAVYVDGFNLYYGMARPLNCKWVNLQELFEKQFSSEEIHKISFFEALISGPTRRNQEAYVSALESLGKVHVVLGEMKGKPRKCRVLECCHEGTRQWQDYEEKHTDVSIAISMVDDAHRGKYEKLILVTADTDLVPAVRMAKIIRPSLQITLCIPALHKKRIWGARPLAVLCDMATRLNADMLLKCQFPRSFRDANNDDHACPAEWSIAPLDRADRWRRQNARGHLEVLPPWCK